MEECTAASTTRAAVHPPGLSGNVTKGSSAFRSARLMQQSKVMVTRFMTPGFRFGSISDKFASPSKLHTQPTLIIVSLMISTSHFGQRYVSSMTTAEITIVSSRLEQIFHTILMLCATLSGFAAQNELRFKCFEITLGNEGVL